MKRIMSLVVVGMFSAMAATAATVPASLQSKVASDEQLTAVRGGASTFGGGTWNITMPSVTITPPATPIVTITPPATPIIQISQVVVNQGGAITITLPTITITPPVTPIVTITPPATPIFSFTKPVVTRTP